MKFATGTLKSIVTKYTVFYSDEYNNNLNFTAVNCSDINIAEIGRVYSYCWSWYFIYLMGIPHFSLSVWMTVDYYVTEWPSIEVKVKNAL